MAWLAYTEQDGAKRQQGPRKGETAVRYDHRAATKTIDTIFMTRSNALRISGPNVSTQLTW
jgi:hypothetical protein